MKRLKIVLAAFALICAGLAGVFLKATPFAPHGDLLLVLGLLMLAQELHRRAWIRRGHKWPAGSNEPRRLRLGSMDYLKALLAWFNAFQRTYAVEPGLYYTGETYEKNTPLLVTANYHLSVFLVARRLRRMNVRLLVVDTGGINVWCAAGKGSFSNAAIHQQLDRYDRSLLTGGRWLRLILPKFAFAGVDLRALRDEKIHPIIGPFYAKDLPDYLANPPYRDRAHERVDFNLQMRLFSLLPGLMQFLKYGTGLMLAFMAVEILGLVSQVPWIFLGLVAFIATAYPILFPGLPGKRFAVKGLSLGVLIAAGLFALYVLNAVNFSDTVTNVFFALATAIFFALSYTGNSAVSNYTRVRKEIAAFLPLNVVLYLAALSALVITEVYR